MAKIVLTIEEGLIMNILCTDPNMEVMVLDLVTEGADPDEIISRKEVEEFMGDEQFYFLPAITGVLEDEE